MKNLFALDILRFHQLSGKNHNQDCVSLFKQLLYFFHPRLMPIGIFRVSSFFYRNHISALAHLFAFMNRVLFGLEISPRCPIGPGLFIPHSFGIVIGAASIGRNAMIYQNVTIGAKFLDLEYQDKNRPQIGDDVVIGTGSTVLGPIRIADQVKIGPHQLIKEDVPFGSKILE